MPIIRFAGICTFVDPNGGDRYSKVILPNAEAGQQALRPVPAHFAFINARRSDIRVNLNEWGQQSLATLSEVVLFLKGVDIQFSDTPPGSPAEMRKLDRVRDICPDSQELADGVLTNPDPAKVSAIVQVRDGATGVETHTRAKSAFLKVRSGTKIVTRLFGSGVRRTIEIVNDEAEIVIGNVDLIAYLFGTGDPNDDHHRVLHCKSFRPRIARSANLRDRVQRDERHGRANGNSLFDGNSVGGGEKIFAALLSELTRESADKKARLAEKLVDFLKTAPDFKGRLDTLGGGCSNTTHP